MKEAWGENGMIQATGGLRLKDLPDVARHNIGAVQLSARIWVRRENTGDTLGEDTVYSVTDATEVASIMNMTK